MKQGTLAFALAHARERGWLEQNKSKHEPPVQHTFGTVQESPLAVLARNCATGNETSSARRRRRVVASSTGAPKQPEPVPERHSPIVEQAPDEPLTLSVSMCDNPLLFLDPPVPDMPAAVVPALAEQLPVDPALDVPPVLYMDDIPRVPAPKRFWSYFIPSLF